MKFCGGTTRASEHAKKMSGKSVNIWKAYIEPIPILRVVQHEILGGNIGLLPIPTIFPSSSLPLPSYPAFQPQCAHEVYTSAKSCAVAGDEPEAGAILHHGQSTKRQ